MPQSLQAIDAALTSNWEKAIEINNQILKENPKNIDALNRLGFAHLNKGNIKKAKVSFEKVIKIDPFNPIAFKNLKKLKNCLPNLNHNSKNFSISPDIFLEEPGITKSVNLLNVAAKSVLVILNCGMVVNLIPKKNRIEVRSENNIYLGVLPDDLSYRLRKLMRLGNKYSSYIKNISDQQITVIIRETLRGKKVKDASFVTKLVPKYHTSIRSEILEGLLDEESLDESSKVKDEDSEDEEEEEEE